RLALTRSVETPAAENDHAEIRRGRVLRGRASSHALAARLAWRSRRARPRGRGVRPRVVPRFRRVREGDRRTVQNGARRRSPRVDADRARTPRRKQRAARARTYRRRRIFGLENARGRRDRARLPRRHESEGGGAPGARIRVRFALAPAYDAAVERRR